MSSPIDVKFEQASWDYNDNFSPLNGFRLSKYVLENNADEEVLDEYPMPWFGIDIGGTLTKLVYFEPTDDEDEASSGESERTAVIRKYLTSSRAYGTSGVRDEHLEMPNLLINGRVGILHFIRFPTCRMDAFVKLARNHGFAALSSTVCATGGGAQMFSPLAEASLALSLHKFDELESLIHGIEFISRHSTQEIYYWSKPLDDQACERVPWRPATTDDSLLQYPFLVVNMGSGVSILAVYGEGRFQRVSGSSIGGGFFHGLCCLLCGCQTFEEAIELAASGDNTRVDKLVRDIYGGDYDLFGLPGDTVASSFGRMIDAEARAAATKEDLARAALVTVTNNIGGVVRHCARTCAIDRVLFVGNFLRVNPIASRRLASSMDYWSKGAMKALFLNHEGYFGAVGCLLQLMEISEERRNLKAQLATMNGVVVAADQST